RSMRQAANTLPSLRRRAGLRQQAPTRFRVQSSILRQHFLEYLSKPHTTLVRGEPCHLARVRRVLHSCRRNIARLRLLVLIHGVERDLKPGSQSAVKVDDLDEVNLPV